MLPAKCNVRLREKVCVKTEGLLSKGCTSNQLKRFLPAPLAALYLMDSYYVWLREP